MDSILSHVSLGVDDLDVACRFYDALLEPLGARRHFSMDDAAAWGRRFPEFWIGRPHDRAPASVGNGTHVAFLAAARADVDRAYAAGLEAGGRDGGAPGERREYGDGYYAGFLRDPFGNKVEVHCIDGFTK